MKHNGSMNVKRMLILLLLKKNKTNDVWTLQYTLSLKRIFYRTVKVVVLIKNKCPGYSVEGNMERVRKSGPPAVHLHQLLEWLSSAGFQKPRDRECPWHTMYEGEKKRKKQLKPEGSAGAVKQVVPFPLRLKATAKLCVGLDPCA